MTALALQPLPQPFSATVTPPGSKSLTNRALVLAALAGGASRLTNILLADDTHAMLDGLRSLGFTIETEGTSATVQGNGGEIPASSAHIFCGNSGTTIRFLAALCALGHGVYRLDGGERMRARPIAPLAEMLAALGAEIVYEGDMGCPPVEIKASGLSGGEVSFSSRQSSQFLSALLLAAPRASAPIRINLEDEPTSRPYIEMTLRLMARFGVTVDSGSSDGSLRALSITPSPYKAIGYAIEPDASNATYFLAAAAVNPGSSVTVPGLGVDSLQGDAHFARVLQRMGANAEIDPSRTTLTGATLRGIDVDMTDMPDAAMTLAVAAVFAEGPTTIRGLHTLPLKETDRLSALKTELSKLGAHVEATGDTLTIAPPATVTPAEIDTYDDHRMAMSFAVAGTRVPGIVIRDPDCVTKTYPGFWGDLSSLAG